MNCQKPLGQQTQLYTTLTAFYLQAMLFRDFQIHDLKSFSLSPYKHEKLCKLCFLSIYVGLLQYCNILQSYTTKCPKLSHKQHIQLSSHPCLPQTKKKKTFNHKVQKLLPDWKEEGKGRFCGNLLEHGSPRT